MATSFVSANHQLITIFISFKFDTVNKKCLSHLSLTKKIALPTNNIVEGLSTLEDQAPTSYLYLLNQIHNNHTTLFDKSYIINKGNNYYEIKETRKDIRR